MKNKFPQKLLITIITLIMTITTIDVKALDVYLASDGYSYPTSFMACGSNGNGCASWTEWFDIRVTIVDQSQNQVPGTVSVDISSYNPYNGEPASYVGETKNPHCYAPGEHCYSTSDVADINALIGYGGGDFNFTGSNMPNGNQEKNTPSIPHWQAYLGYGDLGYAETDNFSTYSDHRRRFSEFAQNLDRKQIPISDLNNEKISFVDFVFKTTKFTDVYWGVDWKSENDKWKASENISFLKRVAEDKENYGIRYYMLVEPIYSITMYEHNNKYTVRGTAKQLARFAANNSGNVWFWPPYNSQLAKNYFCNFIDKSGALGLNAGYEYYCWNDSNFNFISELTREIEVLEAYEERVENACESKPIFKSGAFKRIGICDKVTTATKNRIARKQEKINALNTQFERNLYEKLADSNSALGVNVINLSETMKQPPKEINNTCRLNIGSCENNNFMFSSKLSSEDLFNCIYPSETSSMNKEEREQLVTHYENTDLWCYDDVSYDFTDLKEYYQSDKKTVNKNQLVPLQSGKLTVNRTCFSKNKEESISLNRVFETDDGTYQNEFLLNFLDTDNKYKRGTKYQLNEDGTKKTSSFNYTTTEGDSYGEKYYKYTSTFYYDYDIANGYDSNELSININNYNLNNSLGNTNAINVNIKNSKIVKTPDNLNDGIYINSIVTDKTPADTNLQNGYGLGNKLYNKLNSVEKTGQLNEETLNINETSKIEYHTESPIVIFNNTYEMNKNTHMICNFDTKASAFETEFRVISLNNPFPARDGTSRMPGENWINQGENNVYEYIQNNRGVDREEVYNKEPLYTITLTPSTMLNIRNYNKTHTYTEIDLKCEAGTGRKCESKFLRNKKIIYSMTGTCSKFTDSNYYTCADKAEKSGG